MGNKELEERIRRVEYRNKLSRALILLGGIFLLINTIIILYIYVNC